MPLDRSILGSILPLSARIVLGLIFLYASVDKIFHPAAFAEVIYNYRIVPEFLIHWMAIILPWLELLLGLFLILNRWLPGSTFIALVLLFSFLAAVSFDALRGLDVDCGCFSASEDRVQSAPMWWYVIRDSIFFFLALYVFIATLFKKRGTLQHLSPSPQRKNEIEERKIGPPPAADATSETP